MTQDPNARAEIEPTDIGANATETGDRQLGGGHDVVSEGGRRAWPYDEPPQPLETSVQGVFAVGDVRRGSVKRVASAVGEGSVVVSRVQTHLSRHRAPA